MSQIQHEPIKPGHKEDNTRLWDKLKQAFKKPASNGQVSGGHGVTQEGNSEFQQNLNGVIEDFFKRQKTQRDSDTAVLIRSLDNSLKGTDQEVIAAYKEKHNLDDEKLLGALVDAFKEKYKPKADYTSVIKGRSSEPSYSCSCTNDELQAYLRLEKIVSLQEKKRTKGPLIDLPKLRLIPF